jgi:hypothetical protein
MCATNESLPRNRRRDSGHVARAGVAAFLLLANACHVWGPAELGTQHQFLNGRTRVYRADGSSVIMVGPRIEGDSVIGTWAGTSARMALPRADVQRVEVYRVDRGRTALAGIAIVGVYFAAARLFSDSPRSGSGY